MLQRSWRRLRLVLAMVLLMALYTVMNLGASQKHCPLLPKQVRTIHFATRWFWSRKSAQELQTTLSACGETRCRFVEEIECADAVAFHMWDLHPTFWFTSVRDSVRRRQLWILYGQESEARTFWYVSTAHERAFNVTMTYKLDSDVRIPYGRLVAQLKPSRDSDGHNWTHLFQQRSKTAFIISSHCYHTHSNRGDYVQQLSRYVDVDVFGTCGKPCPDNGQCNLSELSKLYKFYLSFENSRCQDYITEKFWGNALQNHIVPVVLGGQSKDDYLKVAPEGSFIYADDFESPEALAQYLRALSRNATAYSNYLRWTSHYSVDMSADVVSWVCRTCQLLHRESSGLQRANHSRLSTFWNARSHCTPSVPDHSSLISSVSWHFRYLLGL